MADKLIGLAHIGILASNAEVSKDFYLNTLRFELKAEHVLPNGTKLIFCDAGSCQIELVCPPAPVKHPEGVVSHIAIECRNIEGWVEELRAKGVPFESDSIGLSCATCLKPGVRSLPTRCDGDGGSKSSLCSASRFCRRRIMSSYSLSLTVGLLST